MFWGAGLRVKGLGCEPPPPPPTRCGFGFGVERSRECVGRERAGAVILLGVMCEVSGSVKARRVQRMYSDEPGTISEKKITWKL